VKVQQWLKVHQSPKETQTFHLPYLDSDPDAHAVGTELDAIHRRSKRFERAAADASDRSRGLALDPGHDDFTFRRSDGALTILISIKVTVR
jgi:hypothetical protein